MEILKLLFTILIGPLIGDLEGDLGTTLVFGDNKKFHALKAASEDIFNYGLEFFKAYKPSGKEMQEFISSKAQEMGYISLLDSTGHLIGNFSHSAVWNQGIVTGKQIGRASCRERVLRLV